MIHFLDDIKRFCVDLEHDLDPERLINCTLINHIVSQARSRPHPWSTMSPYTSWSSLTDKTWSARCLPEVLVPEDLPAEKDAAEIFRRSKPQVLSKKSTVVFPAFAQYLTDGFIRTIMPSSAEDTDDNPSRKRNNSNHDIDLCPLYGRTAQQTAALRLASEEIGQKGRLKSQKTETGEEYPPFRYHDDGTEVSEF
ncbi:MAG TPA: hypothetical protein VG944_20920, partial [Fimbriimonas sp.]|nr:hypothetical protein [Fimbriimonas sp.]